MRVKHRVLCAKFCTGAHYKATLGQDRHQRWLPVTQGQLRTTAATASQCLDSPNIPRGVPALSAIIQAHFIRKKMLLFKEFCRVANAEGEQNTAFVQTDSVKPGEQPKPMGFQFIQQRLPGTG